MHIVVAYIHVEPEFVEEFKAATLDFCRESIEEEGITRFDFLQHGDISTRFVLYEAYRTPEDTATHKETAHYHKWWDVIEPMMASAQRTVVYQSVWPFVDGWEVEHVDE